MRKLPGQSLQPDQGFTPQFSHPQENQFSQKCSIQMER